MMLMRQRAIGDLKWSKKVKTAICFAVLIGLALGVQTWFARQWTFNFDSDEAVIGLMARHVLQGRLPTYMYGQNYMGTLEAILSAGFFHLWGPNVPALRSSAILLYGLFMLLCGLFIHRLWSTQTALITLLVLAFPGWLLLNYTSRSSANFGSMSVVGMTALLLANWRPRQRPGLRCLRWVALGSLLGLGLWIHPMSAIYSAAIGYVIWLSLPEWRLLYGQAQRLCERNLRVPFQALSLPTTAVLAALGILAFFMSGCAPGVMWGILSKMAKVLLVLTCGALGAAVFLISQRRKELLANGLCLATGFALGDLPQWRAWLFFGVAPGSQSLAQCSLGITARVRLIGEQLLPAMWGTPTIKEVFQSPLPRASLWGAILALALAAVAAFVWSERKAVWSLATLGPLPEANWRSATILLLFVAPLALVAVGTNVYDVWQTRYLVIAWQASAVILAVFFARLIARSKGLGLLLIGLWVVGVGLVSTLDVSMLWHNRQDPWPPEAVASLEAYLARNQVKGGYADYWIAYALDFLTQERIALAPYTRLDRFRPYSDQAASIPVQAYVFWPGVVPEGSKDGAAIVRALSQKVPGQTNDLLMGHLSRQTVFDHQRVGNWDVWLMTDREP